ncbi:hypothetical protein VOLCADRAFT_59959 [Volvox carteri f. nagariensis]|uniref:NADP-dependent oxidoreductase domain-containing protein n=1 Tax=Volvox carteri f. nagariensis TaxID=3068 RepID=D8TU41_VOLCA|nr:uncharacterized protein VOLCADRAFT_59959 [Volvox carteri f. nagariensis]EFJ48974.1 hypothetical protein VOLCADRAFT_59959 [Volvox carteri f. nagariensis]|eukprot:XP_002949871.1 hypothetical protein VOLCADRAFT_59959 [Volvox carteri f. nagariensis]
MHPPLPQQRAARACKYTRTLPHPLLLHQMVQLGSSELRVSEVCLGTMTWGEQNTEAEAHAQLNLAAECGINFLDTAEIYPVPPRAETANRTSTFIGNWLRHQRREDFVVATKVAVANRTDPPGRSAPPRLDGPSIVAAVEGELRRLRTDYIDLLQLHWPDRRASKGWGAGIRESRTHRKLAGDLLGSSQIRAWGLSNETSWGVVRHCAAADAASLPRPATIQNSYSLLHRTFEGDLAEVCGPHNLNLGLLPWSALAGGALTGKYLPYGTRPAGCRLTLFPERYARFNTPRVAAAVTEYVRIAREAGLTPAQLGYAWCRSRPFIPSVIVGATSTEQLAENLGAFGTGAAQGLSEEVVAAIEEVRGGGA